MHWHRVAKRADTFRREMSSWPGMVPYIWWHRKIFPSDWSRVYFSIDTDVGWSCNRHTLKYLHDNYDFRVAADVEASVTFCWNLNTRSGRQGSVARKQNKEAVWSTLWIGWSMQWCLYLFTSIPCDIQSLVQHYDSLIQL